jgi:hypothetical protein
MANEIVLRDSKGLPITDWRAWSRPEQDYRWVPGRSAMELARAWFTSAAPVCPPEVEACVSALRGMGPRGSQNHSPLGSPWRDVCNLPQCA